MNYPERLEQAMLNIYDLKDALREKRMSIRSIEINVTVSATTAKGPDGKLLLTNEMQRKAAVDKSIEDSDEFRNLSIEIRDLERQLATAEASLERLRMEWRLEMLEAEHRNSLAAMKVADAIWHARHELPAYTNGADIELPF